MEKPLTGHIPQSGEALSIDEYEKIGGYEAIQKVIRSMEPSAVTTLIFDAGLLGRGGAGFNTGFKMRAVPMGEKAPPTKYLICNADEMEPGTFKDRLLLQGAPHQLIEGMLISAYAIGATTAYIFLRGEYVLAQKRLEKAIAEAYAKGYLGKHILGSSYSLNLYVHMSAGRYICGEETALINALEGRRANPRAKPPFPQTSGLWGKPTLVNNVETLSNIRHIVNNGPEWYKKLGKAIDAGTKLYGVSGKVKRPGLWELPMGTSLRELLFEHAGGMRDGVQLRAFLPGGASTDILDEKFLDTPLDYSSMGKAGTRMGTGTMIVIDDQVCPVGALLNLEHFFKQESCGFCTPCRDGLSWVEKILTRIELGAGQAEDLELLASHGRLLGPGSTFCALAPGAASPLLSGLKLFKEDFERHIREKRCAWRQ